MTISIELTEEEVSFIEDIVSEARDDYSDAIEGEEVIIACDKVLKALENGVSDDNS